jgi:hypothetical protein
MSLQYSISPSKENIAVNLSLYNPVTADKNIPATIDVGLEKPILLKCNDYKLTIVRFQCPLTSVVPPYSVNGKTISLIIRNSSGPILQSVTLNQMVNSINDFLQIVNNMLAIAHNTKFGNFNYPYIFFQPENRLFYFVIPTSDGYFSTGNTTEILFNQTLYMYFSGFPATLLPNFLNNQDWYLIKNYAIADDGFNYTAVRWLTPGPARKLAAEYPTDYRFNQFQSLMITSNIPIRQETVPLSTQNPSINPNNSLSYISTLPILTDFRSDVHRYGLQNSSIIYFPTSEFRWIDMLSNGPRDRLSFNFLWQSTDQSINQIYLHPGESVSLKLYFRSIY